MLQKLTFLSLFCNKPYSVALLRLNKKWCNGEEKEIFCVFLSSQWSWVLLSQRLLPRRKCCVSERKRAMFGILKNINSWKTLQNETCKSLNIMGQLFAGWPTHKSATNDNISISSRFILHPFELRIINNHMSRSISIPLG